MTRFQSNKNSRTPEEWSEIALHSTKENNLQWNVIGGLILGALAASTTTPLTGCLVAGYFVWDSWKRAGEIQRNQVAIARRGCIAQVLEGDNFADYADQFGRSAVLEELIFATSRGLSLSAAASDFYEENYSSAKLLETGTPVLESSKLLPEASQTSLFKSQEDIYIKEPDNLDVIGSMTDSINNSFILGVGGTGKGILVSNAIREAKIKHPQLKVFYIDPKHDKKEEGYTLGLADVIKRYKCETEEPTIVIAWLEKCLAQFQEYAEANEKVNQRTLLILDEGTVLGLKCKIAKSSLLLDKLSSLTSLGGSRGKNVWFMAQTPFVGGSGIDLSASSQLVTIALVSAENRGALNQWKRSAVLSKIEDIDKYITASPVQRALYFGKTARWYSMPKLENFSGYNRDIHQPLPEIPANMKSNQVKDNQTTVQTLESTFNEKPLKDTLTEVAIKVMEYFDCVKTQSPKSLRDMKKADRLISYSTEQLTEALKELCQVKLLVSDTKETWIKPGW